MLDSERSHKMAEAVALMARAHTRRGDLLIELSAMAAAWPQGGVDGSPSGKGAHSDPTQAAAIHPNAARHALGRLDLLVNRVWADARELDALVTHWTARSTARLGVPDGLEPGCSIVAGIGEWEPPYRTTDFAHVPHGPLLPEPRIVGRWAYDFVGRHGRLPTTEERREHRDGRRHRCGPGCAVA
jgi:hypothetical protein